MKKIKTVFGRAAFLSIFLSLFLLPSTIVFGQSFTPILPLKYGISKLPLTDFALRDPYFERRSLSDDLAVDQAISDIAEINNKLAVVKGKGRINLYEKLYGSYVILSYYLEDLESGTRPSFAGNSVKGITLHEVRRGVITNAKLFAASTKSKTGQSRAMYHALVAKYLEDKNGAFAAKNLQKIKGGLDQSLKARVDFLVAMNSGKNIDVVKLKSAKLSLSKEGKVAAGLLLAKGYAAKRNASYKSELNEVAARSSELDPKIKTQVLSYAIGVWYMADGKKSVTSAPFNLKPFEGSEQVLAISERLALKDFEAKRFGPAVTKYERLSSSYVGSVTMLEIDERIVNIVKKSMTKDENSVRSYAKILGKMQIKYQSTQSLGKLESAKAETFAQRMHAEHSRLVHTFADKAALKNANKKVRSVAISLSGNFLQGFAREDEKKGLLLKVAKVHRAASEHAKAVAIYSAVLDTVSDKAEKRGILLLAIDSQSKLAQWSMTPPWKGGEVKKNSADRTKLLGFYTELSTVEKGNWVVIAQIGLLQINLGNGGEAFQLWTDELAGNSSSIHARHAAGVMMVAYHKLKKWDALESMARLCLKNNIVALAGSKSINTREYLADALFNGGKEAYASENFQKSADKLAEFVKSFKSDKRRDEGLFVLAYAYRGVEKHLASIETLKTLVREHSGSSYLRKTLLIGGEWSTHLAMEEDTMYFFEKFLDRFEHDSEASQVRGSLIELYGSRRQYGSIAKIYRGLVRDSKNASSTKAAAAIMYMELEERYGDRSNADWAAQQALKFSGNDGLALVKVYAYEARNVGSRPSDAKLREIFAKLSKLDLSNDEVLEHMALIQFMIATREAEKVKIKVYNLGLTDPVKALEQNYGVFMASKKFFDDVCAIGKTSHCARAQHELAKITVDTIKNLEEIKIQQTLDVKIVEKFESRKQEMMGSLSEVAKGADERAIAQAGEGATTPDAADQIIFENSEDWNMDGMTNESKMAFIQWTPAI